MSSRYRPLGDCVLLDPEVDPTYKEHLKTGLVIPDAYKYGPVDHPKWGRILAFGPDCERRGLTVGTRVLYAKFGWARLQVAPDKHYAIVREADLLAVDDARA